MKIRVLYVENIFDEGITLVKAYTDEQQAFNALNEFIEENPNMNVTLEEVELE